MTEIYINWEFISQAIDVLTLLVIFWTAYETFRARLANNKAIELSSLPVLIVDFKKNSKGNYVPVLKNFRDVPAYDVKVESWTMNFTDMQIAWSMEIREKDINLVEGNAEQELSIVLKENEKIIEREGDTIIMHSFFNSGLTLSIEYKNFIGEKYYTLFKVTEDKDTDERIIKMLKHPTKYDWYFDVYKIKNFMKTLITKVYLKIIWSVEKPHWGKENTKYDILSVLNRWWVSRSKRN